MHIKNFNTLIAILPYFCSLLNGQNPGVRVGATAHSIPVTTTANTTVTQKVIPDCPDSSGNHLNYTQSGDSFACGTSSSGGGTGTVTHTVGALTSGFVVIGNGGADEQTVDGTGTSYNGIIKSGTAQSGKVLSVQRNDGTEFFFVDSTSLSPAAGTPFNFSVGSISITAGNDITGTSFGTYNLQRPKLVFATENIDTEASTSTISVSGTIIHITGTTTINTINAPGNFGSGAGCVRLIADNAAGFSTGTSGNIALASTLAQNQMATLCYDSGTSKWYPNATALAGTTGSIGGGLLAAGSCTSGTATVNGATTSMAAALPQPATYPGDGFELYAYISAANTVTVKVCAIVALTPTATTYNVRVIQ
jgi:hypothetical protein